MATSVRDDGSTYNHFTDQAPEELRALYLEHYEVRDIQYQIFSTACDIVHDIYESDDKDYESIEDRIYDSSPDSGSIWNAERLAYLDVWNEEDIADIVREMSVSISGACAYWYDRQVEQAAIIINQWVNA